MCDQAKLPMSLKFLVEIVYVFHKHCAVSASIWDCLLVYTTNSIKLLLVKAFKKLLTGRNRSIIYKIFEKLLSSSHLRGLKSNLLH